MVYLGYLDPFDDVRGAPWLRNDELGLRDNVMGN